MDQLPPLGTDIISVLAPTQKIYSQLLAANAAAIHSTPRASYTYGTHPRQQLDVYTPPADADAGPILVFLYGGGHFNGDRIHQAIPDGLAYANVGHFFAARGFTTVIPDYRLMRHGAGWPSGGDDLAAAVAWIAAHLGGGAGGARRALYLMGNSAGGGHVGTFAFAPQFRAARAAVVGAGAAGVVLKGVVFLGTPLDTDAWSTAVNYYGSDFARRTPMGLLRGFGEHEADSLEGVNVVILTSELDPDGMVKQPEREFVKLWRAKKMGALHQLCMRSHNHISPPLALGTGIEREEAWGRELVELIRGFEQAR